MNQNEISPMHFGIMPGQKTHRVLAKAKSGAIGIAGTMFGSEPQEVLVTEQELAAIRASGNIEVLSDGVIGSFDPNAAKAQETNIDALETSKPKPADPNAPPPATGGLSGKEPQGNVAGQPAKGAKGTVAPPTFGGDQSDFEKNKK